MRPKALADPSAVVPVQGRCGAGQDGRLHSEGEDGETKELDDGDQVPEEDPQTALTGRDRANGPAVAAQTPQSPITATPRGTAFR